MTDRKGVTVRLSAIAHQGERRIALHFPYDQSLIAAAKSAGAKWSATQRCWHVPNGREHIASLFSAFKGKAWVDGSALFGNTAKKEPAKDSSAGKPPIALSHEQEDALGNMRKKLEIARYSPRSIQVYLSAARQLFVHFPHKHPNDIRTDDIGSFQHHLAAERKVSNSTLNQMVNAVRYYYMNVVGDAKRVTFIERPRKETRLPLVLSKTEVAALLSAPTNLKHQAMLALAYSGGLRVSEVLALRPDDLLFDRGLIRIRGAKGNKDRTTLLERSTADLLKRYMCKLPLIRRASS